MICNREKVGRRDLNFFGEDRMTGNSQESWWSLKIPGVLRWCYTQGFGLCADIPICNNFVNGRVRTYR